MDKRLMLKAELDIKISRIIDLQTPLSFIIHLDGIGGYKLETKLGDKATNKILTDKK